MYHPRLRGSHYAMGHHYGALLYEKGFRTSQLPDLRSGYNTDLIKSSAKLTCQFYPEICEEIEGFADGAKSNYEHLACFLLSIGITQSAPHCSCCAAVTDEGVLFGRNHDYFKRFKKFSESSLIEPIGFNRTWYQSQSRYEAIIQALAKEKSNLSLETCQNILSGKYGFVCQYSRKGDFDTIWSVVANLSTLRILRAEGNPSRVKYKEDSRLASIVARCR